jgi:hypothetical protein
MNQAEIIFGRYMASGTARYGTAVVPIITDTHLPTQTAILTANGELRVGPNTDLEVLFFHMNMTPRDKRLLAAMKIGL